AHLCQIRYGNDGNADAVAPVFEVSRKGDGTFSLVGDDNLREKLYFVGAGASGNAGILLPHEEGVIEFFYVAGTTQVEGSEIFLQMADDAGIADAATRLGRRGDDATNYAMAKELAQLVSAGMTNGVYYGTVKDSNCEPVGDYLVAVTNGDSVVRALTDANGRYVTEPCRINDMRVDFTVAALSASSYVEVEGATENTVVFAQNLSSEETFAAETAENGRYVFRGLSDGPHALFAQNGDSVAVGAFVVSEGGYGTMSLKLDGCGAISGRFLGDGSEDAPIVALIADWGERFAAVSADGTYSFTGLPTGEYVVLYGGDDYADYTLNDSVKVVAGTTSDFDIVKTNNISSTASNGRAMLKRAATARLMLKSASSQLATIQRYLLLLTENHPVRPSKDRDCIHNRKLYNKDLKAWNAMYNMALSASRLCDDLESKERALRDINKELAWILAGQGLKAAKGCKKLVELAPMALDMIRTIQVTDSVISVAGAEDGFKAAEELAKILLDAGEFIENVAMLSANFSKLEGLFNRLERF
ncbi:MAG: carboxypeptidase regulatory-like domain-containing protein, partial [Kiritimatiellae bacterium]|nr:carboxypeptidase regulatory-like domain-containing protein [Kiritimatiellia bacterium]